MRWIILAAAAAVTISGAAAGQYRSGRHHSDEYHSDRYQPRQSHAGSVCGQRELTRIRVSKIKPGGSLAGFRDAVAAHTRWYQAHGYRIAQRIAPVVAFAIGKGASPQEVMTFATSDDVPKEKRDAGWNAFVAKYRANSEIESETIVCMPAAS